MSVQALVEIMPVEFSCKAVAFVAGVTMPVAKVNRKTVRVVQS